MSSSTFKELRRALPMNRQKFPWEQARAGESAVRRPVVGRRWREGRAAHRLSCATPAL